MAAKVSRVSVDLFAYPDLVVMYLAMKLRTLRGIKTILHGLSPRCTRRGCHTLSRNHDHVFDSSKGTAIRSPAAKDLAFDLHPSVGDPGRAVVAVVGIGNSYQLEMHLLPMPEPCRVFVVVDREYGKRLANTAQTGPVWIVDIRSEHEVLGRFLR